MISQDPVVPGPVSGLARVSARFARDRTFCGASNMSRLLAFYPYCYGTYASWLAVPFASIVGDDTKDRQKTDSDE